MKFLFMRHGETLANTKGLLSGALCTSRLTQLGRRQVERAAHALFVNATPPDVVLLSPALRARQTAEIIRNHLRLPEHVFMEEPGLLERHFGCWESTPFETVKEQLLSGEIGEGGESMADFKKRVAAVAERIADMQGREVLAISHGMVWQTLHELHNAQTPWIGNADVYRVTLEPPAISSEHLYRQEKEE